MSAENDSDTAEIGIAAGLIWSFLNSNGPSSLSRLVKELDAPRDLLLQGVGWLAREDKLLIVRSARGRLISLR